MWASLLLGNESADLKPAMQAAGAGGVHNWDLPPQHSQSLSTSPLTELNSHLAAQLASAQPVRLPPALQPPPRLASRCAATRKPPSTHPHHVAMRRLSGGGGVLVTQLAASAWAPTHTGYNNRGAQQRTSYLVQQPLPEPATKTSTRGAGHRPTPASQVTLPPSRTVSRSGVSCCAYPAAGCRSWPLSHGARAALHAASCAVQSSWSARVRCPALLG